MKLDHTEVQRLRAQLPAWEHRDERGAPGGPAAAEAAVPGTG